MPNILISPETTPLLDFASRSLFLATPTSTIADNMFSAKRLASSSVFMGKYKGFIFSTDEYQHSAWNHLFCLLGPDVFRFLLQNCSLFRQIANFNFVQISGPAVSGLRATLIPSLPPTSTSTSLGNTLAKLQEKAITLAADHDVRLERWKTERNSGKRSHALVSPTAVPVLEEGANHPMEADLPSPLAKRQCLAEEGDEALSVSAPNPSRAVVLNAAASTYEKDQLPPMVPTRVPSSNRTNRDESRYLISRSLMFYKSPNKMCYGLPLDWKGRNFARDLEGAKLMVRWMFDLRELPLRLSQSLPLFLSILKRVHRIHFLSILNTYCPLQMPSNGSDTPTTTSAAQQPRTTPFATSTNHISLDTQLPSLPAAKQRPLAPTIPHSTPSSSLTFSKISQTFESEGPAMTSSGVRASASPMNGNWRKSQAENDSPLTQTESVLYDSRADADTAPSDAFDFDNDEDYLLHLLVEPTQNPFRDQPLDVLLPRFSRHHQVSSFVYEVVRKLLPREILGSVHNWQLMEAKISDFVGLNRFDVLSSSKLLDGFKITHIAWLYHNCSTKGPHTSEDVRFRTSLFAAFLVWLFDDFIIPLLSTSFYITETMPHRNQVFYYRREVWTRINQLGFQSLLDRSILGPVSDSDAQTILKKRELGSCFLRFLPKSNGVRPIVNLKRFYSNPEQPGLKTSINLLLRPIHAILTHEARKDPEQVLASSMMSNFEVHQQLADFKTRLLSLVDSSGTHALPRLYFVKTDVISAFDEIRQEKLMDILAQDVLSLQRYLAVVVSKIRVERDKSRMSLLRTFVSQGDPIPPFEEMLRRQTATVSNSILVKNRYMEFVEKAQLLQLLSEHISRHLIKFNGNYYVQKRGIPQGSTLSSLLCSIYFASLEKTHLSSFINDSEEELDENGELRERRPKRASILLRWIDDFLYITTDLQLAESFFEKMAAGFEDYGTRCNPAKTVVNFALKHEGLDISNVSSQADISTQLLQNDESDGVPVLYEMVWCGWSINTRTLEIRRSYPSRIIPSQFVTNQLSSHQGVHIFHKIQGAIRNANHLILFDGNFNCKQTILENVFDLASWVALRLIAVENGGHFASTTHKGLPPLKNAPFILNSIFAAIQHGWAIYSRKKSSPKNSVLGFKECISSSEMSLLAMHGFATVLKRSERFKEVCESLVATIKASESSIPRDIVEAARDAVSKRKGKFSKAILSSK